MGEGKLVYATTLPWNTLGEDATLSLALHCSHKKSQAAHMGEGRQSRLGTVHGFRELC